MPQTHWDVLSQCYLKGGPIHAWGGGARPTDQKVPGGAQGVEFPPHFYLVLSHCGAGEGPSRSNSREEADPGGGRGFG